MGNDGRAEDRVPVGVGQDAGPDVRQEDEGEPLEAPRDAAVRGPEEQRDDQARVARDEQTRIEPRHHLGRLGHPAEVGADVEDVRDHQERTGRPEHPSRVAPADDAREPTARDHPEPRTHQLDRHHQREGEDRRPEGRVAEARARDRVGRDARGVVVGRPGHEAGAEVGEEPPEAGREDGRGGS